MSLAQYALGAIGVFVSWFMMPHVGRRRLYVVGQALVSINPLYLPVIGPLLTARPSAVLPAHDYRLLWHRTRQ